MKIKFFILLVFLISLKYMALGQVSQGGKPLQAIDLKNSFIPVINLPVVNNEKLLQTSFTRFRNAEVLKPFKFAYTFNVNINPSNSGKWIKDQNGYNIWQVSIKSEGAFSLNLIMQPFRLPRGARLFVFNKEKTHVIGAFTKLNNKSFNSLALSPVQGDEIIIQYEEPVNPEFNADLAIKKVNHDFAGILTDENGRRPLGISGSCNIDINCEIAEEWEEIKNSVCRIIVEGIEICTGSLVNNTSNDKTPYVLTANHCFSDYINGEQNTVFLFNYESPYCGSLDGDITNSVSGSLKIAESDSLDFSLVELTLVPPPEYRPFYAGWDMSGVIPDSATSIHHPLGDIKKIALDNNSPLISSFGTYSDYLKNGFWKTLRWDYGTTEAGSSGGPYFNHNKQIIGTLTGGAATCSNPVNDYFERFDIAWDHYSDTSKQLKHWLDPDNSGVLELDGVHGYVEEDFCDAFTNLVEGDSPEVIPMYDSQQQQVGNWAGTNSYGITEYVEKFSIPGDEVLNGISLGIGKLQKSANGIDSYITVKVYTGTQIPEDLIYSKNVMVNSLVEDAMNFVSFDEAVQPTDTFFIGFDVLHIHESVTFVVYQAVRNDESNTLFFKKDNNWYDYSEEMDSQSASLAFELVACNVNYNSTDTSQIIKSPDFDLYPNPSNSEVFIRTKDEVEIKDISVFDLLGREVDFNSEKIAENQILLDLWGNSPGIYFIRLENEHISASKKLNYQPY